MSQPGSRGLGGHCLTSDYQSDTRTPPCSPPGTYERLSGHHSHPHDKTGKGHAGGEQTGLSASNVDTSMNNSVTDHCL